MNIISIINGIKEQIPSILLILSALYGLMAAIVKACPTLGTNHWLLPFIKFLAIITNNQSKDSEIRANQDAQPQGETKT